MNRLAAQAVSSGPVITDDDSRGIVISEVNNIPLLNDGDIGKYLIFKDVSDRIIDMSDVSVETNTSRAILLPQGLALAPDQEVVLATGTQADASLVQGVLGIAKRFSRSG